MRITKGIAFLGAVMILSWSVTGITIPEAEASYTTASLNVLNYDDEVYTVHVYNIEKSSTSYSQPIELGMFSWLLFW